MTKSVYMSVYFLKPHSNRPFGEGDKTLIKIKALDIKYSCLSFFKKKKKSSLFFLLKCNKLYYNMQFMVSY